MQKNATSIYMLQFHTDFKVCTNTRAENMQSQ